MTRATSDFARTAAIERERERWIRIWRLTRWSEPHNRHEPLDRQLTAEIERATAENRKGPTDEDRPIKIERQRGDQGGVKGYATRIVRSEINGPQRERQRN